MPFPRPLPALLLLLFLSLVAISASARPAPQPDCASPSTQLTADQVHQQLLAFQRDQQSQIDAMNRRNRLQTSVLLLLLLCLLLVCALAWALWRIGEARRHQALEDPLTGLKNRRFVPLFMEHEAPRLRRSNSTALILIADIDHFKNVNDHWGHDAGDQALAQIAKLLRHCTRNADVVARWGGEEFLIICPQSDDAHVEVICSRICNRMRQTPIEVPGKPCFYLTLSIGAALYAPASLDEPWTDALTRADTALYEVKRNGRDHWSLASRRPLPDPVQA